MINGFQRFFEDSDNASLAKSLDEVYFSAFTQPDLEVVIKELKDAFS